MPTIRKTLLILEYIRHYEQENDFAPTLKTIGDKFGMRSPASVHRHLQVMQSRGWIKRAPYDRRIEILKQEHRKAAA
jgi:repressor LexA